MARAIVAGQSTVVRRSGWCAWVARSIGQRIIQVTIIKSHYCGYVVFYFTIRQWPVWRHCGIKGSIGANAETNTDWAIQYRSRRRGNVIQGYTGCRISHGNRVHFVGIAKVTITIPVKETNQFGRGASHVHYGNHQIFRLVADEHW